MTSIDNGQVLEAGTRLREDAKQLASSVSAFTDQARGALTEIMETRPYVAIAGRTSAVSCWKTSAANRGMRRSRRAAWGMTMTRKDLMKSFGRDQILEALGIERHNPYAMVGQAVGVFGLGILVGTALGLAFAPKAGGDLRNDLAGRFDELRNRFGGEGVDKAAS